MRHAIATRTAAMILGFAGACLSTAGCGGQGTGTGAIVKTTDDELKQMEEESRSNEALDKVASKKKPR